MKNAVLAVSILATVVAQAAIENVTVRQLWPWSGDVDIAFTVTGSENTAVKFTAQYDGVEPFVIPEGQLSGDFFDVAPGRRHARWRVDRAGLAGKTLFNLQITAEPDATDHTYLILNLVDGSYTYTAAEPEGGWFNASADYYKTKMVFRRVPAGTFTMGYSDEILQKVNIGGYGTVMQAREMTISTDYYMSVYKTTLAQHLYMTNRFLGGDASLPTSSSAYYGAYGISYDQMRGHVTDDGINWPHTGYDVAPDSVIAMYRKITDATFSPDWAIDLPTSAQWARAARATTPDGQIWHVGGTVDDTMEAITNYASQVGNWVINGQSRKLGQRTPNGWGFYDFNGSAFEWGLDWWGNFGTTTDPVGPSSNASGRRVRCGAYQATSQLCWMIPGFIYYYSSSTTTPGYRLCIHLKKIKK